MFLNHPVNLIMTPLDIQHIVVRDVASFFGRFARNLLPPAGEGILFEDQYERSRCGERTFFRPIGGKRRRDRRNRHDNQTDSTYDGSGDIVHEGLIF